MKLLFLLLGASIFAVLMYLCSTWYLQPLLVRQTVLRRLNLQSRIGRIVSNVPRRRASTRLQSELIQQLSMLSDLLDATARNLRLGRSMASSLQAAANTSSVKNSVITELIATTTRGESFADATNRLIPTAKTNELIFALRTIDLAATGGVGGVLALERAAIVLRERSTNINDRQMQASQALLSTKILSWAPVVVAGWLITTSSSVRNFLILSASGWFCILFGLSLNYAGRRWMQTIVAPIQA
ncbi:MAG: type II secretion system F family protein [Acidimicrobiaceae bacterium]